MAKISKFVYWTPRIFGVFFVLFLVLFSFDVFESATSTGDIILGLLIHNIPAIILAVLLFISWRREIVGAVTFVAAGILYILSVSITAFSNSFEWYYISWSLIIAGPAFLIGYLFYLNWKYRKKKR